MPRYSDFCHLDDGWEGIDLEEKFPHIELELFAPSPIAS